MSANLLVELFTEELPPKALKRLGDAFAGGIVEGLKSSGLLDATSKSRAFATPRRLAVYIQAVLPKGSDRPIEHKLMPAAVAMKEGGAWSDALRRKLAGMEREKLADVPVGAKVGTDMLLVKPDGKTNSVFLRTVSIGQTLEQALSKAIEDAIAKLPIPKVMSYQLADGATTVKFVRPAHALVALHGDRILALSTLGLDAGRVTHGHRFQGAKDISLDRADQYEARLENEGQVIADFDKRKAEVARQLSEKAQALKCSLGAEAEYGPLLDEVTALVEHPTVYIGEFEAGFLAVPQECLILTMRQNQKYFPLFDANAKLTNNFLIVSNMKLANSKNIVEGNQRVVRPRLSDARFFFETDKKIRLADRVPQLASVVYHNKLGSQLDRIGRVRALAGFIATKIGADAGLADRAALIAKADLVTNMVGEFPELQGIMGRYYALADGEDPQVANAIGDQYRIRLDEHSDPANLVSMSLFLADRVETLVGIWSIGLQPSGDKDPFGLRRAALGIISAFDLLGNASRATGKAFALTLQGLVAEAAKLYPGGVDTAPIIEFVYERYRNQLAATYDRNAVDAVISMQPPLDQVESRVTAVVEFGTLPEAASLASANKRIGNILKKTDAAAVGLQPGLLSEAAEKALAAVVEKVRPDVAARFAASDYAGTLKVLAQAREPVDAFFNDVMVMAEDPKVRDNRLALLRELHGLMNQVADISKLAA
ncbi:MAG TPA: glycine--tRNA ligase subunit beta [Burkholderiales bacterium]|nr:glycine--tRNA ligase subunit beta [Burkholderiales bacterium]